MLAWRGSDPGRGFPSQHSSGQEEALPARDQYPSTGPCIKRTGTDTALCLLWPRLHSALCDFNPGRGVVAHWVLSLSGKSWGKAKKDKRPLWAEEASNEELAPRAVHLLFELGSHISFFNGYPSAPGLECDPCLHNTLLFLHCPVLLLLEAPRVLFLCSNLPVFQSNFWTVIK